MKKLRSDIQVKKVVVSGSSKLQDKVNYWIKHFKDKNYEVLDYPKLIEQKKLRKGITKNIRRFLYCFRKYKCVFLNE